MDQLGMDTGYAMEVDVRNEEQITAFLQKVHNGLGPIDYILHGVAFGNPKVIHYSLAATNQAPPSYLDIPFEDFYGIV